MTYGCAVRLIASILGLFAAIRSSGAQDVPAYTPMPESPGFRLPSVGGSLTYSISASQSVALGYNGNDDTYSSTNISGNLAYISTSKASPFSLVYSGGYLFASSDQPGSFFHNLAASQVIAHGRWNAIVSDSVSYLPNAPVGGLSGVAGLGDLGVDPIQVLQGNGSGLYSNYGQRVANTATGSLGRSLTNRTSLFGSGASSIFRFPGSDSAGLETNQTSATGGVSHNLSAISSYSASYSFVRSTYPAYDLAYDTHNLQLSFTRQWTDRLSTTGSVGPQYSKTASADATITVATSAAATYRMAKGNAGLSFSRGVNSGQGIATAGNSNSLTGSYSHILGAYSSLSTNVSYNRFSAFVVPFAPAYQTNSLGVGAQLSRSFTRKISAYASFTGQHQVGSVSSLTVNAFNGTTQTFAFGLTYSPLRPIILGQ